ncbi:hypothetical protein BU24DRAFT_432833 [Aaosphaeria arxii CBS 175.79]|uniref:THUMP domain-containing protein n=1 Tax=Aaosphaeria arxii CBS 175.79 TaxID=1450172 RepID=A0A6A5Y0L7_9PLEO|nr:uncharacterized protein BU24DRAFT_432833 [Aaosphaeria arxii CBS 175.79]KAF2018471.1 hypothetical protein BU24DRAFT_432833 [Aaosphaeria arxii CBS 175.79]
MDSKKRKADPRSRVDGNSKRQKGKKQWSMPRRDAAEPRGIQPGDTGIWATCAMKKEGKSVAELRDLFHEYALKLYGVDSVSGEAEKDSSDEEGGGDIEAEINKELDAIRKPSGGSLFTSVRLETQCLIFFKTRQPVEPVSFINTICKDAADGVEQKLCRFVKRLTPITATDKATERGLDAVAEAVLAPHFHGEGKGSKKFAIRTSIRNNKEFTRDKLIKKVAAAVGPGHKVDLSNYDLLILVEVYQNILGMSVVGADYDQLKRYNLEELHGFTEQDASTTKQSKEEGNIEKPRQADPGSRGTFEIKEDA